LGPLPQPDDCGNSVEVMKATKSKTLRMKPTMHVGPERAKGNFREEMGVGIQNSEFRSHELQELQEGMPIGTDRR
jgi:hypothetical protein